MSRKLKEFFARTKIGFRKTIGKFKKSLLHIWKKKTVQKPPTTAIKPEVRKRRLPRITIRQVFTAFSLAFFESLGKRLAKAFEFEKLFGRAGVNVHPIKYGAETIAMTVIAAVFTTLGYFLLAMTTPLTIIERVIGVLIALMIPIVVFTLRFMRPYIASSSRKVETENELPFFMAYVATMVKGGYSLEKVFERAAQLKVFKAIRREAQRVITRVKMLGDDPVSALEKVAMTHPSSRFRDIMLGYTTTLRSGGDVSHYLEIRTRELFEYRTTEVKSIIGRLMSFLEIYTVFGVVVSIALFVFFAVSAAISAAQAARSPEALAMVNIDISIPALYNFFVLPILGLTIAFTIHINQPRTPISYGEVYVTLFIYLPVSIAVFIAVLIITDGLEVLNFRIGPREVKSLIYALSSALITASLPPAIKHRIIIRKHRGLIKATADFLRDISEIRKTGLSPERCIILVSGRDYKTLTPILERVSVSLTLGTSLEEALRKALRGVKEWFVVASLRFLTDSIVVGGGSPDVIDTLARFTQVLSELEEETRKRMRTQVILPYLGAMLLASTPTILLYMLLSLAKIPVAVATPLILVLSVGSIVNAYIMGLIAGKASQATVSAGFLHSVILTLVTTMTLGLTLTYIGL